MLYEWKLFLEDLGFVKNAFASIFGKGEMNAVVATGIVYIPMISRLTRSSVLTEKTKTYVETARSLGYSDSRIIFGHIFQAKSSMVKSPIQMWLR